MPLWKLRLIVATLCIVFAAIPVALGLFFSLLWGFALLVAENLIFALAATYLMRNKDSDH